MKTLFILGMLYSTLAFASGTDPENICPDLRGDWTCSLEINDFPEPAITNSYRNFQENLKDGEVVYEIGGWEFTAKPGVETKVKGEIEGIVTICIKGKLVLTYKDESGVETIQTLTRVSPVKMTSVALSPGDKNGNYSTAYFCDKSEEGAIATPLSYEPIKIRRNIYLRSFGRRHLEFQWACKP